MRRSLYRAGMYLLATWMAVGVAWAQTPATQEQKKKETVQQKEKKEFSGEITVTSRKTDELLKDIPLTIRAFTALEMAETGVESIDEVAERTPGLTISNYFGSRDDPGLRFRGMDVGTRDRLSQSASAFLDGIYLPGSSQFISTEDVERVEVVKGPQSAYFGRSSFGGAINMITKAPSYNWMGDLALTLGENGRQDLNVGVGGPLSDKAAFRVFGRYYDYDGGWDNPTPNSDDLGAQSTLFGHASLSFSPTENSVIGLRVMYSKDDDGAGAFAFFDSSVLNCGPFTTNGTTGTKEYYCGTLGLDQALPIGFDTTVDKTIVGANWPKSDFGLEQDFTMANLDVDLVLGNLNLVSRTGYIVDKTENMDSFTGAGTLLQYYRDKDTLLSEELRLHGATEKIDWMVGAYYLDGEYRSIENGFGCASPDYLAFGFLPGCPMFLNGPNVRGYFDLTPSPTRKVKNEALFGSVTYRATGNLSLSLEGRLARENLDFGTIDAVDGSSNRLEHDFDSFTPRLIVDYKPNQDTTVYLNIARGNKAGNFNSDLADAAAPAIEQFERDYGAGLFVPEERVMNYELGIKRVFDGGRHLINAAIYYMDWKNQTFYQFAQGVDTNADGVVDGNDEFQIDYLVTAGKSRIEGAELFYRGMLGEYFDVLASFNYNDAEYVNFEDSAYAAVMGDPNAEGKKMPRSPKTSATLGIGFTHPVGSAGWDFFARADDVYKGSTYTWALNLAQTESANRINVRTGIRNDRYEITLFANNITDDKTLTVLRRFSDMKNFKNAFWGGLPLPREIGVTFRMTFF